MLKWEELIAGWDKVSPMMSQLMMMMKTKRMKKEGTRQRCIPLIRIKHSAPNERKTPPPPFESLQRPRSRDDGSTEGGRVDCNVSGICHFSMFNRREVMSRMMVCS